jgi:hypothetical protein
VEHHHEKEAVMSDTTKVPKIRVHLRTDAGDTEAPMLGFVRWKLVPLPVEVAGAEHEQDEGPPEPSTRTP